jgi:hypothetical protein
MWFARNFGYFFLVPGVLMLFGAIWTGYRAWSFRESGDKSQGTVVSNRYSTDSDGGGTYHPEVEFATPDGQRHRFISKVGQSPAAFKVGEQVPVVYDRDTPESASIDTIGEQYFGPIMLSILGSVFTLVGAIPLYLRLRRDRLSEWLKANGQAVQAFVSGVQLRTNFEVNGRNPYRISAQWTDSSTNRIHLFNSENLWFDPGPYMSSSKTITVLFDPKNPKRYWMDTTFLPKL